MRRSPRTNCAAIMMEVVQGDPEGNGGICHPAPPLVSHGQGTVPAGEKAAPDTLTPGPLLQWFRHLWHQGRQERPDARRGDRAPGQASSANAWRGVLVISAKNKVTRSPWRRTSCSKTSAPENHRHESQRQRFSQVRLHPEQIDYRAPPKGREKVIPHRLCEGVALIFEKEHAHAQLMRRSGHQRISRLAAKESADTARVLSPTAWPGGQF